MRKKVNIKAGYVCGELPDLTPEASNRLRTLREAAKRRSRLYKIQERARLLHMRQSQEGFVEKTVDL